MDTVYTNSIQYAYITYVLLYHSVGTSSHQPLSRELDGHTKDNNSLDTPDVHGEQPFMYAGMIHIYFIIDTWNCYVLH